MMMGNLTTDVQVPGWLPDLVRNYLDHAREGVSLREIARREGMHASTVLRQVRRLENRRDDPLIDAALDHLGTAADAPTAPQQKDEPKMTAPIRPEAMLTDAATLAREGRRILRRLAEPGAMLAIAPDMEKAAVLREFPDGRSTRTAVVDRQVAQAFALKDWIACRRPGRVASYEITAVGRAALKRFLEEDAGQGMAEAPQVFAGQHRIWAERTVDEDGERKRIRYNMAESPVAALGRRRDKDGVPFLDPRTGRGGRTSARGFRTGPDGSARRPELGPFPDRRRAGRVSALALARPKARAARASGWRRPCASLAPALATWCCAAAATLRGWRLRKSGWAGRRARARWCCASRWIGCGATIKRFMAMPRP